MIWHEDSEGKHIAQVDFISAFFGCILYPDQVQVQAREIALLLYKHFNSYFFMKRVDKSLELWGTIFSFIFLSFLLVVGGNSVV